MRYAIPVLLLLAACISTPPDPDPSPALAACRRGCDGRRIACLQVVTLSPWCATESDWCRDACAACASPQPSVLPYDAAAAANLCEHGCALAKDDCLATPGADAGACGASYNACRSTCSVCAVSGPCGRAGWGCCAAAPACEPLTACVPVLNTCEVCGALGEPCCNQPATRPACDGQMRCVGGRCIP